MPAAAHGWNCSVTNQTAIQHNRTDNTYQNGGSTSTVTVQNQNRSTGASTSFVSGDMILFNCLAN
jgi:hypothetical protein